MRRLTLLLAALLASAPASAAPKVVASIVPVQSIVAAVMGDMGTPELLLKGSMSEHRAVFTPSQIAMLGEADLVFIVGHGLEAKLDQLSGSEAVNGRHFIGLSDAGGVKKLAIRQGGAWEPDDDAPAPAGTASPEGVLTFDPHVWLDPDNARAMALAAAAELGKADPANAAAYAANARGFAEALDKETAAIAAELAPVRAKPFIVFHDAYHYFEKRFGLAGVGSISDVSAQAPSAARLSELRDRIISARAACVFREPQFDDRVVQTVIEGTGAKEGVLDPIGQALTPGPAAYGQLLRNLADGLRNCLSG